MTLWISRTTELLHRFLELFVREGDCVADCTLGKGYDTAFLAARIGLQGYLYGFDIQASAVRNAEERLVRLGFPPERHLLVQDTHERIDRYINRPVRLFVYNLGYLPEGDRSIVTRTDSTVNSIRTALPLLEKGGLISLVLYPGHPEGAREALAVKNFLALLSATSHRVMHWQYLNTKNDAPEIMVVQRVDG